MSVINDKAGAKRFLNSVANRVLKRIVEADDTQAAPPPDVAPAAPPPAAGDQPNNVSISKVASGETGTTDVEGNDLEKGNITMDMVIDKLNSVRSGKSFKDEAILGQMTQYFDDLNDNEKLALYAFLKGIAQIVTGEIAGQTATEPEQAGQKVVDQANGPEGKVKHVKPQVIKRAAPKAPAAPPTENTAAPIQAKQR
jgi:hypothetical protein